MKTLSTLKRAIGLALAGFFLLVAAPANITMAATSANSAAATEMVLEISDKTKPHKPKKEKIIKPKRRKHVKQQRTNHGPRKPIFPQADRKSALHIWFVGL